VKFAPRDSRQYAGSLYAYDGSSPMAAVSLRGVGKSPSQPTNPPGKGAAGGNSQNGTSVPGQGNGLYGVPPRGPFIGKADDGNATQVVPPTLSRDDVRVRNFPIRNSEPAPRPGNGMSQGNPAIGNGRAAPDYRVNNGISGAASGRPSSPVVQRPSAPPAPRSMAPPRGPGMPGQTSPRRRAPGR